MNERKMNAKLLVTDIISLLIRNLIVLTCQKNAELTRMMTYVMVLRPT